VRVRCGRRPSGVGQRGMAEWSGSPRNGRAGRAGLERAGRHGRKKKKKGGRLLAGPLAGQAGVWAESEEYKIFFKFLFYFQILFLFLIQNNFKYEPNQV